MDEGLKISQRHFYNILTTGTSIEMSKLFTSSVLDPLITSAISSGARIDAWSDCLNPKNRPSLSIISQDSYIPPSSSDNYSYTTTVEEDDSGNTLLAVQEWTSSSEEGGWRLVSHATVPWGKEGGKARGMLRCDCRGCVALTVKNG
jgi:hypothetical protein